ncbi:MAG TPA: DUF2911 domain-containing protein [Gemmatimonadaceae bacterium]|nr:DUF2911 domain-containing protein [Gemmatimonadaceae bacterium]
MRVMAAVLSLSVLAGCAKSPRGASADSAAPADGGVPANPAPAAPAGGAQRPLSPRDSARVTVGSATLAVNYGRPSMRGRAIFGQLVPYDRVWRTGANEATAFTTSRDLAFGAATVPAGSYTLYTLPKAATAPCSGEGGGSPAGELIVNKQTGQWGTEYDQGQDLARIPMQGCRLSAPVEQFEIRIVPQGSDAGVLQLAWETTRYSIPFRVK